MNMVNRARVDADADLVAALRRDEAGAMERLVERYADRVYRLAMRITGSREDAQEVVQDALWTVGRKINTFKGESAFGSWLYRIAANAAYMKLRARRGKGREIALDDVLPALDSGGVHFDPMDDWSLRVDDRALQGELREGMSNPDIADTLGISLPAVKSRVHRSRLLLRKRLSEYMNDGAPRT